MSIKQTISFILAIIGLGVSVYLTYIHYNSKALVCPSHGVINCEQVVTSPQSVIFGLPVAVYGLAYFVWLCLILNPYAWSVSSKILAYVRLFSLIAGMGFVIYLISLEALVIKAVCIWCTSVHIITLIILILVISSWYETGYYKKKLADDR
jgi:uncharacterized membrane protein